MEQFFREEANWGGATWGILLMRLWMGTTMFFAGLGKFTSPKDEPWALGFEYWQTRAEGLMGAFANTPIPNFMLVPYTYGVSIIEIIIGAFLVLGIKTKWTLVFNGLLLISLGIGLRLIENHAGAANIGIYLTVTVLALILVRANRLELWK